MNRLTPPQQQTLAAERTPQGEQAWLRWWQEPTRLGLTTFLADYGDTPDGLRGWMRLGLIARDEGAALEALLAWRQAATHRSATRADGERLARMVSELRTAHSAQMQHTAGPFVRHLEELEQQLRQRWNLSSSGSQPLSVAQRVTAITPRPLWSIAQGEVAGLPTNEWFARQQANGVSTLPITQPVVLNDLVLWTTPQGLAAYHRQTGSLRWGRDRQSREPAPESPIMRGENPRLQEAIQNPAVAEYLADFYGREATAHSQSVSWGFDASRLYLVPLPRVAPQSLVRNLPLPARDPLPAAEAPTVPFAAVELSMGAIAWEFRRAHLSPCQSSLLRWSRRGR
jgi:hypothetical protein